MRASRVPFTQGVVAAWRNVRGGTRPEGTSVRSSIATSGTTASPIRDLHVGPTTLACAPQRIETRRVGDKEIRPFEAHMHAQCDGSAGLSRLLSPGMLSLTFSATLAAARVGFHAKHAEEDFRVQAQTRAARKHVALRVPGDQRHVLSFYRSFTVSQPAGSRRRDERSADGLSPKDNIGQGMARGAEGSQDGDRRVKGPYSSGGNMSSHQKTNSHMLIRGGEQGTGGEQHAGGRGQHHSIGKDWEAEVVAKRIFRKLQSLRGNDKVFPFPMQLMRVRLFWMSTAKILGRS